MFGLPFGAFEGPAPSERLSGGCTKSRVTANSKCTSLVQVAKHVVRKYQRFLNCVIVLVACPLVMARNLLNLTPKWLLSTFRLLVPTIVILPSRGLVRLWWTASRTVSRSPASPVLLVRESLHTMLPSGFSICYHVHQTESAKCARRSVKA